MLICIPGVLSKADVADFRRIMDESDWEDGRSTAGAQSALVKRNEQLPPDSEVARKLGNRVLSALTASPKFISAAIPLQQYRTTYSFLAPKTYSENWIDLITPTGNTITLDGTAIPMNAFKQVGGQPFSTASVQLPMGSEGHEIHATSPFGLVVYGYGSRTSYMYPGGLDLRSVFIAPPPPPN